MRKFGLIGKPLGHSFSGKYFREKFDREGIKNCLYSNYELPDISAFREILTDPELCGLNVTIPYKEDVLPFLHNKDKVVAEMGACNCIRIERGILTGFNTDVIGFERSFVEKLLKTDERALILGTGGSSKAVAWVMKKLNIPFHIVSRKKSADVNMLTYEDLNREIIQEHRLIINTTPLGMTPHIESLPLIPYEYVGPDHYLFDLVYNPAKTSFLQRAEAAGARTKNGADMLAIQAEASWAIWNNAAESGA